MAKTYLKTYRVLVQHSGYKEPSPSQNLIAAILRRAVLDKDREYLESKLCEYYCELANIDYLAFYLETLPFLDGTKKMRNKDYSNSYYDQLRRDCRYL